MVHHPREDAGRAATQTSGVDPRVLERLPRSFQEQALLRVHRQRLVVAEPEEAAVEVGDVGEEAAVAGVGLAGLVGVGVVDALDFPAAVLGELGDRVLAAGDQAPELVGVGDPTGKAAGDADDRDRLVRPARRPDRDRRAGDSLHLLEQVAGYRQRRRVVEDDRRLEPDPGRLREPVAQLDRAERVESEVFECRVGVDRLGGGMAEDGGDVLADLLEH